MGQPAEHECVWQPGVKDSMVSVAHLFCCSWPAGMTSLPHSSRWSRLAPQKSPTSLVWNAFQASVGILEGALFSLSSLNAVQTSSECYYISVPFPGCNTLFPFTPYCSSLGFFMVQANLFKWQSRSLCNMASSQNCDLFDSEVKWSILVIIVLLFWSKENYFSFFSNQAAFHHMSSCLAWRRAAILQKNCPKLEYLIIPCFILAFLKSFVNSSQFVLIFPFKNCHWIVT